MFETLDEYQGTAKQRLSICEAIDAASTHLAGSGAKGDRSLVARAEATVKQDPSGAFHFDSGGMATMEAAGREFCAGRFVCRSLADLGQHKQPEPFAGKLRLFVLAGTSPITDIGALQAIAPVATSFQVASQYNCLESPGAYLSPVADYFHDPTQGPRASISAYPGTLLRHYAAPGRLGRFVQKAPTPQLNLLHSVCEPGVAQVSSGYLLAQNIGDPKAFATLLQERFLDIEVGVHENTEVVLGANWDGPVEGRPLIGQVFTSTLAAGGYGRVNFQDLTWLMICRQLQRAAYLGTLLGAVATGQRRVVLTLIGGGVFGNPLPLIWESILWACAQVQPRLPGDLTVVLNGRELGGMDINEVQRSARDLAGDLILCSPSGARIP